MMNATWLLWVPVVSIVWFAFACFIGRFIAIGMGDEEES